jgi:hypothetical protein
MPKRRLRLVVSLAYCRYLTVKNLARLRSVPLLLYVRVKVDAIFRYSWSMHPILPLEASITTGTVVIQYRIAARDTYLVAITLVP